MSEDKILLSLQSAPVDLEEHQIDISGVDCIAYDILVVFAAVLYSLPFLEALQCGDFVSQFECSLKLPAGREGRHIMLHGIDQLERLPAQG